MTSSRTTKRISRKGQPCPLDLFAWSRDTVLLSTPAVRAIARRTGVSPALALVIAELAGLANEAGMGDHTSSSGFHEQCAPALGMRGERSCA